MSQLSDANLVEPVELVNVVGGASRNFDPAVCGSVSSLGALTVGAVAGAVGKRWKVGRVAFLGGAAGGGLFTLYASDACH